MSSQPFPIPAVLPEYAALVISAGNVAEHSFFAFAEVPPEAADMSLHGDWYHAFVTFSGPFAGVVVLALPGALARELSAAFLGDGEPDAFDDSQVQDTVGEFANMTTGLWLTGLNEAIVFELGRPEVTRLERAPDLAVPLLVNGQPLMVAFELQPE